MKSHAFPYCKFSYCWLDDSEKDQNLEESVQDPGFLIELKYFQGKSTYIHMCKTTVNTLRYIIMYCLQWSFSQFVPLYGINHIYSFLYVELRFLKIKKFNYFGEKITTVLKWPKCRGKSCMFLLAICLL
jgi:hypothetical protein